MTESEWLTGRDALRMLDHLGDAADARKLRLFACACCKVDAAADGRLLRALEAGEEFADGSAGEPRRRAAEALASAAAAEADEVCRAFLLDDGFRRRALDLVAVSERARAVRYAVGALPPQWAARRAAAVFPPGGHGRRAEKRRQAALLRCLFGNPFRPVVLDPAWAGPAAELSRELAAVIYDAGAFSRLPLLAEALEDAGFPCPELLDHCRDGGEHVRGCWAVDLLLGKG